MEFFHPAMSPFTLAFSIMGAIALLEICGLAFGVAFSELVDAALPDLDIDADIDLDVDSDMGSDVGADAGGIASALSWLGLGKVPLLIVLAAFLGAFGAIGMVLQNSFHGIFGNYLSVFIAAPVALVASLPVTRILSSGVAKIFPKEETDALSTDSFIGRIATIIRGEAHSGNPAEAKLTDAKGTAQYILVEPDEADVKFTAGEEILLVEKEGAVFRGTRPSSPAL